MSVAERMAASDLCLPALERLLVALEEEHCEGYRNPKVVLPYGDFYRVWRDLQGPPAIGDTFFIHTAQGRVQVLPEV